jgi:hypothetical protein
LLKIIEGSCRLLKIDTEAHMFSRRGLAAPERGQASAPRGGGG